jgi:hypothetical protein
VHVIEFLMYMSPEDATYLWMVLDDCEELRCIVNGHGIQPFAACRYRLVMQADEGVCSGGGLQVCFQLL